MPSCRDTTFRACFAYPKIGSSPLWIMPCRVGAWSDMLQSMGSPSCSNATRWWCSIKTWGFSRTLYPSTALLLPQTHMPHLHSKFQLLLLRLTHRHQNELSVGWSNTFFFIFLNDFLPFITSRNWNVVKIKLWLKYKKLKY